MHCLGWLYNDQAFGIGVGSDKTVMMLFWYKSSGDDKYVRLQKLPFLNGVTSSKAHHFGYAAVSFRGCRFFLEDAVVPKEQ